MWRINRNELIDKINGKGIGTSVHYIPVHTQPFYKKNFDFKIGDFPLSENFYKNEVSIPIHVKLTEKEINFIIKEIKKNLV